jgi:ABC-2 type transport system permease protein
MVFGLIGMAFMGLLLGAATLQMARHFWSVGESVAGALYLFCGAIFPPDMLPAWLRPLSYALPLTYWLESLRRSILGTEVCQGISPSLSGISDAQLILILVAVTLMSGMVSVVFFRWSEHQAREKGMIDMTTQY